MMNFMNKRKASDSRLLINNDGLSSSSHGDSLETSIIITTSLKDIGTPSPTSSISSSSSSLSVSEPACRNDPVDCKKGKENDCDLTTTSCFICMNDFSKRCPGIVIPCTAKCSSKQLNPPLVHAKCMYEWKERQRVGNHDIFGGFAGTCPLCRSALDRINYVPADMIRSSLLFMYGTRRYFCFHPISKDAGMIRCVVRVVGRTGLTQKINHSMFYLQAPSILKYPLGPLPSYAGPAPGDQFLLAGRNRDVIKTGLKGVIDISFDQECKSRSPSNPNHAGKVVSSFTGLEHTVYTSPNDLKGSTHHNMLAKRKETAQIATITYCQNRYGKSIGPRKVKVAIPNVSPIIKSDSEPEPESLKSNHSYNNSNNDNSNNKYKNAKKSTFDTDDLDGDMDGDELNYDSIAGDDIQSLYYDSMRIKHYTDTHESSRRNPSLAKRLKIHKKQNNKNKTNISSVVINNNIGNEGNSRATNDTTVQMQSPKIVDAKVQTQLDDSSSDVIFGANREPYWLDSNQAYSLDFSGRVTIPSNKNFQIILEHPDTLGSGNGIVFQFGKVWNYPFDVYTCDFRWPLSPIQAYGIALSAIDRKLACA